MNKLKYKKCQELIGSDVVITYESKDYSGTMDAVTKTVATIKLPTITRKGQCDNRIHFPIELIEELQVV